jgi:hypothetical protein
MRRKVEENCNFVLETSRDACARDDTELVKISLFSSFGKVRRAATFLFYLSQIIWRNKSNFIRYSRRVDV